MIALPYNDSITTMYVIKPIFPNRLSLLDLMNRLDYAKIDKLTNQMENSKSVIRFPKMDLQNKVKLEKALKALGVQSLFTPGGANFALMVDSNTVPNKTEVDIISRINDEDEDSKGLKELLKSLPNPGMHVDSVLHDVKLTINEYGTEAVAATAGVLARTAKLFYADSPFYMFIRNEKTKLVTFSAAIFDPTA
ncbi:Uncharacterized protein OBRU01_22596 [Operophtera brumata]|uniref:Serpin domain-containing protein n=1 Tax=Operophtera brumata TaxID=104452 RepID=A0A0L7KS13_OPEBR|nr:Uncharacterized protein OBRU01_22596 [Operophtera brumata]